MEHNENNTRKKAQGCSHFNCKNFQKKVPHTKNKLIGNIAKIFLLQGRYREKEKGGKEGNTSQKSFKQMKHYMNKSIVKLSHQKKKLNQIDKHIKIRSKTKNQINESKVFSRINRSKTRTTE